MPDNTVRYGLRNVHIAFRAEDVEGEPAWDTPIAIPGAIRAELTPQGDEVKVYADDKVHFTAVTNDGYSGDLENSAIPDEILAEMLNYVIDANGAIIEDADALPKEFAIGFETQGDKKNRRAWFYQATAARPTASAQTREKAITPKSDVLPITVVPITIGGRNVVKGTMELSDTNQTEYEAFFESVYTEAPVPEVPEG